MQCIQLVGITPKQLQDAISEDVKRQLEELKKSFEPKAPAEFLTRSEVAKLLKVDLSTVHNWRKKGRLTAYGKGGKVLFKRAEVENSLIKL